MPEVYFIIRSYSSNYRNNIVASDIFSFRYSSYRRYFGIVIGHYQVALYSARRDEMVEVVQATLFYMNPDAPIPVHSLRASIPYEVKFWLWLDM